MFSRPPSRSYQGWEHRVYVSIDFWWVCSSTFVAEFREDVRITIPAIAKRLRDNDLGVFKAAIEGVLGLAEQGMC